MWGVIAILSFFFLMSTVLCDQGGAVKLDVQDNHVVIDNGILQLTLSNPEGFVSGISYNGIDNLLEHRYSNRGYWDLVWREKGFGTNKPIDVIPGKSLSVITQEEDRVEVSFARSWSSEHDQGTSVPLNIDKRFVVLRNSSGFYTYTIFEHLDNWPGFDIVETRIAFKLREDIFRHMALTDARQRVMPVIEDRDPPRGQPLDYPEAVLLLDPINPDLKGEVDDKYQYSIDNKDNKLHGWMSTNPPTGFWQITPSDEFRTGGPMKQSLTSHAYPISLAVFISAHYAGDDLVPKIDDNEPWKKVFGPIFLYLNSGGDTKSLWEDAKMQMSSEVQNWPYDFPASTDFPKSNQRGSVNGRLLVNDRYATKDNAPANAAYVGLALPDNVGSWQRECKGYQFWTQTDSSGNFKIKNIRPGTYNLYAWVPGFIGDYNYNETISITEGSDTPLGDLVYAPPRNGPTLWEIGVPDRTAAEFYVPDPDPKYINKLYLNIDRFRQYGLWERYTELYPDGDLVYTVGTSNHTKDWFYAQVTRKSGNNTYVPTTWQIKFNLDSVDEHGTYVLRIAVASGTFADLQVLINNGALNRMSPTHFITGPIGGDNSIARHGIHGLYWLFSFSIDGSLFVQGENTIFLTQSRGSTEFDGIMYDYVRLEGPDDQ